jgi:hypothetical protein
MFGKIALKFSTGFLIETNETCYKTKVNFIPITAAQGGSRDLELQVGDYVSYVRGVLRKEPFDNCTRCHKRFPMSYVQSSDCYDTDDLKVIRGPAVIINKVSKTYKHSRGWKITVHMEDPLTTEPSTLHFVIFENSPLYRSVGNSDVGDLCFLKGIEISTDGVQNKDDNILVRVFHLEFKSLM